MTTAENDDFLDDLVETETPQSGPVYRSVPESENDGLLDDLVETETPQSGPVYRSVPGTHDQETRKQLAFIILTLIAVFYGAILGFFLFGLIDTAKFTAAIAGVSGIQALAAAAIGFYYGSKNE